MITDERLKQLMVQVGMPNSISLMRALQQCDMEARLDEREACATLCDAQANEPECPERAQYCAAAIRAR